MACCSQVPAYKYSKKYGARAPCFSRATISPHPTDESKRLFIIAGTSAVVGEDSVHIGDWVEQTHETLRNTHALLRAGCNQLADGVDLSKEGREALEAHIGTWPAFGLYDMIRVYVRIPEHADDIMKIVRAGAPKEAKIEYRQVTLALLPFDHCATADALFLCSCPRPSCALSSPLTRALSSHSACMQTLGRPPSAVPISSSRSRQWSSSTPLRASHVRRRRMQRVPGVKNGMPVFA